MHRKFWYILVIIMLNSNCGIKATLVLEEPSKKDAPKINML
jgi:hypothetical protein